MTTQAPWPQEPTYVANPDNGNAEAAWQAQHQHACYIDNTGQPIGALPGGQWVDDPTAPIVPPTNQRGMRFAPADPTDPIWQAGTMYGTDGYDLWVQSDLCKQIIAEQQANPLPIPDAILHPVPPYSPPPPRPAPPGFWEFLAELKARFEGRW